MQASVFPRKPYLPPPGGPRWVCPPGAALPLVYLSWGRRCYGKNPVPVSRQPGWVYAFVQRGRPQLVLADRRVQLAPGDLVVIHPDCASGWADDPNSAAEMLTWTWRGPPPAETCRPEPGCYRPWQLDAARRRTIARLHAATRRELQQPDPVTTLAVANLHAQLDVVLARASNRPAAGSDPAVRMELASRWLAENLMAPEPVRGLCDYLHVSPATLGRLFHRHLRISPQAYHLHLRLTRARELLERGSYSVKQAAYEVGYRHPHDFTRAFTRWAKYPPAVYVGRHGRVTRPPRRRRPTRKSPR